MARRLRSIRVRLGVLRTTAVASLSIALILGGSGALRDWVLTFALPGWAAVASYLVILFAIVAAVEIPFRYVGGYRLEKTFRLSTQNLRSWLRDLVKSFGLGLGSTVVAGSVLLWLIGVSPGWWWLAAWALSLVVTVLLGFLAPIVLVPLFFRYRPLGDAALRARFETLAAKANVPVLGVFELRASNKTRRSNAAVMGLGRTRRVVVTDTLFQDFSPDEVETVLAHELAHQKYVDPLRGFVLGSATSLIVLAISAWLYWFASLSFGIRSGGDMAGLPLLATLLGVVSLPLRPIELRWSRIREARADQFSLELTRDPTNFIGAMVKLHDRNLGVAHPRPWEEWLFYSHPSGRDRVETARAFRASHT